MEIIIIFGIAGGVTLAAYGIVEWWANREYSKNLERRTAQKNLEKLSAEVRLLDEAIRVSEANREDDPRQK